MLFKPPLISTPIIIKIMQILLLLTLLLSSTLQQITSLLQRPDVAYFANPTVTENPYQGYLLEPSEPAAPPETPSPAGFESSHKPGPTGPIVYMTHQEVVDLRTSNPDDFKTLAFSGDGKSFRVIPIQSLAKSSLPFNIPTTSPSSSLLKSFVPNPKLSPSADLKTIQTNPFPYNPSARAITPGPQTELNLGIIVIYEITFYNDCPRNQAWMHLHAWDDFIIYDPEAGVQIYPTPGTWSRQICSVIKLPSKCGCNKLWIVLYNWQNPSYYAVWYEFFQSQNNCYNCPQNPGEGFYNRTTCKCECAHECSDCSLWRKVWVPYPTCGCRCRVEQYCAPPRYFSKKTCGCECMPVCCKNGQSQDPMTCNCR